MTVLQRSLFLTAGIGVMYLGILAESASAFLGCGNAVVNSQCCSSAYTSKTCRPRYSIECPREECPPREYGQQIPTKAEERVRVELEPGRIFTLNGDIYYFDAGPGGQKTLYMLSDEKVEVPADGRTLSLRKWIQVAEPFVGLGAESRIPVTPPATIVSP
jgi:hypothetical protein